MSVAAAREMRPLAGSWAIRFRACVGVGSWISEWNRAWQLLRAEVQPLATAATVYMLFDEGRGRVSMYQ